MKFNIVQHFRWIDISNYFTIDDEPFYILGPSDCTAKAKGGVTVAGIIDGDTIRWGISYCHVKDNFEKKKGRTEAIRRANMSPAIVTENLEFEVAKAFSRLLSITRLDRYPNLNLAKYVEIIKENPDYEFRSPDGKLRELYFKD